MTNFTELLNYRYGDTPPQGGDKPEALRSAYRTVNTDMPGNDCISCVIEMGKVYGLSTWGLFWRMILPGALSSILVGVRFSLGIMWLTLIVAETIAADSGIGYMAMNAREFMQTDVVVLSILLYALFGKLADVIARALENYWLQWNPNYSRS
jgi:sulfonate transport system permease protein